MSVEMFTYSELEAYWLLTGRSYSSTDQPKIRECADYIIQLAEKIKSSRTTCIMNSVANLTNKE